LVIIFGPSKMDVIIQCIFSNLPTFVWKIFFKII